jgi:hypothetical protein
MEPCQQLFPRGLRKTVNFQGFYKNSEFPRGSKISNLVNRVVWILNGMALGLPLVKQK